MSRAHGKPVPQAEREAPGVDRGRDAFGAAVREAETKRLDELLLVLQKLDVAPTELVRGNWGGAPARTGEDGRWRRPTGCPLHMLFNRGEINRTIVACEDALGRHGFRALDFYRVWDAGYLQPSELSRCVDKELIRRRFPRWATSDV
jgi:hypothetical protein